MTTITRAASIAAFAADFARVKPTARDAKRNPGIDVQAVWRDDIEHTIRCQGYAPDEAAELRRLCGVA